VDTTVGMARQNSSGASNFNVFQPGQTYYLFLLYAQPSRDRLMGGRGRDVCVSGRRWSCK
jgi:hypothetical protein